MTAHIDITIDGTRYPELEIQFWPVVEVEVFGADAREYDGGFGRHRTLHTTDDHYTHYATSLLPNGEAALLAGVEHIPTGEITWRAL
jgi:hypothetical protein